jgi:hypothetical protein
MRRESLLPFLPAALAAVTTGVTMRSTATRQAAPTLLGQSSNNSPILILGEGPTGFGREVPL